MKTILVTGASSFLGHHVLPSLRETGNFRVLAPTSKTLNLLDRLQVIDYIARSKPDIILHMAAKCGGIGANKNAPAQFIHDNLIMASNLFEAIRAVNQWGVARKPAPKGKGHLPAPIPVVTHFYGLGSVCAYPKFCPVPFKEDDFWNGYPEETNAPYGTAKRTLLVMQQAFRQQFGLKGAHLVPVNMYGEYDHFDLKDSHVIPALINKFVAAKKQYIHDSQEAAASPNTCPDVTPTVEIWGDGTPTREFLYAGDCAEAIVKAIVDEFDYADPMNLGTGQDISIYDLAHLIREVVDVPCDLKFTGEVSINGQPKRRLDVSRAKNVLGFEAKTALREGLKKTVDWYLETTQPNKEVMKTEKITNSDQATAVDKPQKIKYEQPKIGLYAGPPKKLVEEKESLRKAVEEIQKAGATEISEDAINQIRESIQSIEDELGFKPTIKSKILENPGSTIFIKAKTETKLNEAERKRVKEFYQKDNQDRRDASINRAKQVIRGAGGRTLPQTDMQRLTAEVRDAVGDPAKLKEIAKKIDEATPSTWKGLTPENREFYQDLISRLVFVEKVTKQDHREHLEKIAEQGRRAVMRSWYLPNRNKCRDRFFYNSDNPDPVVPMTHASMVGNAFQQTPANIMYENIDHNNKISNEVLWKSTELDDKDARVHAVAEMMVANGLIGSGCFQKQIKEMRRWDERFLRSIESVIDRIQKKKDQEDKQMPGPNPFEEEVVCDKGEKLENHVDPVEALCRAGFTREQAERKVEEGKNKLKYRMMDFESRVRSDISEESVKEPELTQKPVELPPEELPPRDLDYYINRDKFKRLKADESLLSGSGHIRRVGGPGEGNMKRTESLDREFKEAIDSFENKYGKRIGDRQYKIGIRYSDLVTSSSRVTDTEIMAAKYVSDKIEPPTKELNSGNIACPKKNENEASKPDPVPETVNEDKLKAAVKKLHHELGLDKETKVEKPKKKTILSRVKSVVKNIFKKTTK